MTRRLLIGNSGFVGGSLSRHIEFSDFQNSTSPTSSQVFDEVYCAAPSAIKWLANKDPQRDLAHVQQLIFRLSNIKTSRFFLFSTVDVYDDPTNATEESKTVSADSQNSYGFHRSMLEQFVMANFSNSLIMRLSGLVDMGLKKNPIFDLGAKNNLELLNSESRMQFLPLPYGWAWLDTKEAREMTGTVNLTAEPVWLGDVAKLANISLGNSGPKVEYDIRSSRLSNEGQPYLVNREKSLSAIKRYLDDVN